MANILKNKGMTIDEYRDLLISQEDERMKNKPEEIVINDGRHYGKKIKEDGEHVLTRMVKDTV